MEKLNVLIVEDEVSWQKLLTMYLTREGDITIVDIVQSKRKALAVMKRQKVDVVIMDINLTENNLDGIFLAAEISSLYNTKIIMLTGLNPREVAVDAFNAGAMEFVSKTDYKNLPYVIRNSCRGNLPLEALLKDFRRLKEQELLGCFTECEKEILVLLNKGYKREMIQKELFKSESTVKNQISKILKKLDVRSTKEAVKKVRLRGLLNPEEHQC